MGGQGGASNIGQAAEDQALQFLERQGLRLVERNFQCRRGELDLIMRDADTLVFVEVRYRSNRRFGGALASIGAVKQRRLHAAAEFYLQGLARTPACRFDVVAIEPGMDGRLALQWIRNAIAW